MTKRIKWKTQNNNVGTIPKPNRNIVKRGKIDTPNTNTR